MLHDPDQLASPDGYEDEEDEESSAAEDVTIPEGGNSANKNKKKKKKKKKKKSDSGQGPAAGSDASTSASTNKVDKNEAEKRFNTAVDSIKGGDEMWINLANCNIFCAKTKKLMDALKANKSVTSVDLSSNHIGDDGAQAIASVLGLDGAPELISLDLRANAFTDMGLKILEGLGKVRKHLVIKTGPLKEPEPEPSKSKETTPIKELKELSKGKMFRKYFQTDDDDDDPSTSNQESQLTDAGVNPEELWDMLEEQKMEQSAIPQLSQSLQQLCVLLQREIGMIQSANSDVMDGSKPHLGECLQCLSVLQDILLLTPRQVTVQYSSQAQSAVGSHRVWVAEAVASLLGAGNNLIDGMISATDLVPMLVHLAWQHPNCSALHARVLRIVRSCFNSRTDELATPLFVEGWAADLNDVGPGAGDRLCRPLPELLAAAGTAGLAVPSGVRSALMGFVLELCKLMQAACDEAQDTFNALIKAKLAASPEWSEFNADLAKLTAEQEGDLGGPRPIRAPVEEGSELAELAGGGLMSGREILALLQGMSAMGVMT